MSNVFNVSDVHDEQDSDKASHGTVAAEWHQFKPRAIVLDTQPREQATVEHNRCCYFSSCHF